MNYNLIDYSPFGQNNKKVQLDLKAFNIFNYFFLIRF
jgi:hypothetical protein